jgi:hypothetical protein
MQSASAPTSPREQSVAEIMQLMGVIEINGVPQQDDVVSCGVHVIPN